MLLLFIVYLLLCSKLDLGITWIDWIILGSFILYNFYVVRSITELRKTVKKPVSNPESNEDIEKMLVEKLYKDTYRDIL